MPWETSDCNKIAEIAGGTSLGAAGEILPRPSWTEKRLRFGMTPNGANTRFRVRRPKSLPKIGPLSRQPLIHKEQPSSDPGICLRNLTKTLRCEAEAVLTSASLRSLWPAWMKGVGHLTRWP